MAPLLPKTPLYSHVIMADTTENTAKMLEEGTVRGNYNGKAREGLCEEVTLPCFPI